MKLAAGTRSLWGLQGCICQALSSLWWLQAFSDLDLQNPIPVSLSTWPSPLCIWVSQTLTLPFSYKNTHKSLYIGPTQIQGDLILRPFINLQKSFFQIRSPSWILVARSWTSCLESSYSSLCLWECFHWDGGPYKLKPLGSRVSSVLFWLSLFFRA